MAKALKCSARMPQTGDRVKLAWSDRIAGSNFTLEKDEVAEVVEVNVDGLFKLKDPRGNIGDGFQDRKYFIYEMPDKASSAAPAPPTLFTSPPPTETTESEEPVAPMLPMLPVKPMVPAGPLPRAPCTFCSGTGSAEKPCDKCTDGWSTCDYCLKHLPSLNLMGKCIHCDGEGVSMYSYKSAHGIIDYSKVIGLMWLKENAFKEMLTRRGQVLRHQAMLADHKDLFVDKPDDMYTTSDSAPFVLSHFWIRPGNPDPRGEHITAASEFLEPYRDQVGGVFMDYPCLPQAPRAHEEETHFRNALASMDLLYSSDVTFILRIDTPAPPGVHPYHKRGWCTFEHKASGTKAASHMSISLAQIISGRCQSAG